MNLSNIPAVLASTSSVTAALAIAKAKDEALKSKFSELNRFLHPERYIEALKQIILDAGTDFELVENAQREIATISAQTETVRQKALDVVRPLNNELSKSLRDLLTVALQEIENLIAQASAAENEFFSGFGISGESTALVKHVQTYAAQLRQMRDGFELHFTKPGPTLGTVTPVSGAHVFAWFGH